MWSSLPPGAILMLGALLVPFLKGRLLQGWVLALPVLSFVHLLGFEVGHTLELGLFDLTLTPIRIDRLSLVWGYVFHAAAFLGTVFALHVEDRVQHVAALSYAGSAIAAAFTGDLVSLFVFWELTAITSVFLVWARRTPSSYDAGLRYLILQVLSGVLLLAGTIFRVTSGDGIAFVHLGDAWDLSRTLIFLAFGIKAAFPLLHTWLEDAYPEATPTGTVFLSAFTTKLAIYTLARGFAGTELLIPLGATMAVFPMFYAVIVDDLRRVLAYALNNQLGFMVLGVGVGTELAINGVAAHAVAHISYKSLLFMVMGAVLWRTGTARASELGGLYRTMPFTAAMSCVGAAAIGAPLLGGFVSKSMIVSAAGHEHLTVPYLALQFGSAAVFLVAGLKITFYAFFGDDSGKRPEPAPPHMRVAMGLTALLCITLGVAPGLLYDQLPYPVDYVPYTVDHVVSMMQLLLGAGLAFAMLHRIGAYPEVQRDRVLDADWLYRRLAPALVVRVRDYLSETRQRAWEALVRLVAGVAQFVGTRARPAGPLSRSPTAGTGALSVAILLTLYAALYFELGDPDMASGGHGAHGEGHGAHEVVPAHGASGGGASHGDVDGDAGGEGDHGASEAHGVDEAEESGAHGAPESSGAHGGDAGADDAAGHLPDP